MTNGCVAVMFNVHCRRVRPNFSGDLGRRQSPLCLRGSPGRVGVRVVEFGTNCRVDLFTPVQVNSHQFRSSAVNIPGV